VVNVPIIPCDVGSQGEGIGGLREKAEDGDSERQRATNKKKDLPSSGLAEKQLCEI